MELWNRLTGIVTLELTCADPERILSRLAQMDIVLWNLQFHSPIHVSFQIRKTAYKQVHAFVDKNGAKLQKLGSVGILDGLICWKNRPMILICLLLLVLLTVILPERILFVEVIGNEQVPSRLILEQAADLGLSFGADRRALRSEEIKNQLLERIDSLEWVGVNTYGTRAVITVRERREGLSGEEAFPSALVAAADGIVSRIEMNRGTLLVQTGQAVTQGQILVSGYTDLGICTRATGAQAEIYALTVRDRQAVMPSTVLKRGAQRKETLRIGVVFGKKRINFYSDSGILPPGCGKMTYSLPLRLPGGDCLPVVLVIEHIVWYDIVSEGRAQVQAQQALEDAARQDLLEHSVAGQILSARTSLVQTSGLYTLQGKYQCREMIARPVDGVYLEGDTKDDS